MTAHEHPGQTSPLKPGVLRDFESFSSAVMALNGTPPDRIVRELYSAAMMKAALENGLTLAQQGTRSLRRVRMRLSWLHALLQRALRSLETVETCYLTELEISERFRAKHGYDESRSGRELSKIKQQLARRSDGVADAECTYAALIHPRLRTAPENRLAGQTSSPIREISASPVWREKSPQIDHMFIGQIAACLEQFEMETSSQQTGRVKKLSTSASFFRQVFEAAFGVIKLEGTIAKELERQRKNGREFFVEPNLLRPYPNFRIPLGFVLLGVTE